MKAVLISIQPKWCNLIAQGKKTVEVRKTKPKLETPFKCYIYMTKNGNNALEISEKDGNSYAYSVNYHMAGKVIGEFVCDKIEEMERDVSDWLPKHRYDIAPKLLEATCLTEEQLWNYGKSFMLYGWHISELKIYDEPKRLGEFKKACGLGTGCEDCDDIYFTNCKNALTRPPQSWCYVEEL